jgi:hypothetical protein
MKDGEDKSLKEELILQRRDEKFDNDISLDRNKTLIIIAAMVTLTAALVSGKMNEAVYSGLMGSFLAFTFGRIFAEQNILRKP